MGTRTLHLVRHGQYLRDPERLTPLGVAQAECIAARLKDEPVVAVHVSTAPRARETAEAVQRSLPAVPVKRTRVLVEGIPTLPRWKLREPLASRLGELPEEHVTSETGRVRRAVTRFVRPTRGADRVEVLVFHGNWIRAMVCASLDLPLEAWWDMDINHCSLTTLVARPHRVVLERFNEAGHLPPGLRTFE